MNNDSKYLKKDDLGWIPLNRLDLPILLDNNDTLDVRYSNGAERRICPHDQVFWNYVTHYRVIPAAAAADAAAAANPTNPYPSTSDGSTANDYRLPPGATELQDLISHCDMNAQLGEIFRAAYRYGRASHSDKLRDAKKIKFYIEAEIKRLENSNANV